MATRKPVPFRVLHVCKGHSKYVVKVMWLNKTISHPFDGDAAKLSRNRHLLYRIEDGSIMVWG